MSDMFHIYRDSTMFEYSVNLVRTDLTTNRNERYSLKVYSPILYGYPESINPLTPRK